MLSAAQALARRSDAIDWDAAWAAWFGGRPDTTIRARRGDLRSLAAYLELGDDEQAAARALVVAGPSRARGLVHAWRDAMQRAGEVSTSTIARRMATIGSLFHELTMHGLAWDLRTRRPKVPRFQPRYAPPWDAIQRVAAVLERELRWSELFALRMLSDCALRRAEVVQLCEGDLVDVGDRIVADFTRKGGMRVRRTISARAWEAAQRVSAGGSDPTWRLVRGQRGPLTDSGLARWVRRWGLHSPHALRRAAASELNKRGVPVSEIRAFLGHESLATTQVYILELNDPAGQATRQLEAFA